MKLRTALFASFTFIAVLPIFIFGLWLRSEAVDQQLKLVEEKHLLVAENMTAALDRYVNDVAATFDMTIAIAASTGANEAVAKLLRDMHFQHVCLIDENNQLVAFQPGLQLTAPASIPVDVATPLWQASSFKAQFSAVNSIAGAQGIWVYKRTRSGKLAIGRLATDYVVGMQQQISFGEGGHAAVVDQAGNVIAHPRHDWMRAVKNLAAVDPVKRMMSGERGISYFYSPAVELDMVAGFSTVEKTGWGVMVPQPLREVQAAAQQITYWVLAVTGGATVVAIVLGWLLASWLSQPLSWLNQHVQDLAEEGTASIDESFVASGSASEFSTLIKSFHVMHGKWRFSQNSLRSQNALFSSTLDSLHEGVALLSPSWKIQFSNHRFSEMFGHLADSVLVDSDFGKALQAGKKRISAASFSGSPMRLPLASRALQSKVNGLISLKIVDGKYFELVVSSLEDGRFLAVVTDVSDRLRKAEQLRYLATHDELTGLLNRREFLLQLGRRLQDADARMQQLAVAYIDMQRFKEVNDTLGHAFGDELLIAVASRIENFVSENSAARLGGDEFAIVLDEFNESGEAIDTIKQLTDSLQQPYKIRGQAVKLAASTGVAISPVDGNTAEELLQAADLAMYSLKRRNGNRLQRYSESMSTQLQRRTQLESALINAVANNEFTVVYQPVVEISSESILGVECLLRWSKAEKFSVEVTEIIEICEQIGLIHQVTENVFTLAFKELENVSGTSGQPLVVSLNLSGSEFTRPAMIQRLRELIHASKLAPERIEVELTESKSVLDTDAIRSSMEALREMGVKISLDNFGSGCSSFRHLSELPIDSVKIYSGMMDSLSSCESTNQTVVGIIGLAKRLGVRTIATGIESNQQLAVLRSADCDALQGRLYAAPMALQELRGFLAQS